MRSKDYKKEKMMSFTENRFYLTAYIIIFVFSICSCAIQASTQVTIQNESNKLVTATYKIGNVTGRIRIDPQQIATIFNEEIATNFTFEPSSTIIVKKVYQDFMPRDYPGIDFIIRNAMVNNQRSAAMT
jgi:ABC-type transporter MlaC component